MSEVTKKKVLVAEDDPSLAQILSSRLTRAGIEVVRAKDGEETLRVMREAKPDLVLLDLILPGKYDGFEVLQKMKEDPTLDNRPVVIISNLGQESDIAKVRQLGAVEYFVKAKTSIDDLINKIQGLLGYTQG
ncbi:MAG: response regulator [Candidatus Colwellbacteria bacterium]|nr:response regulator [Candidatus Colwellbacteria bacterium]